MSIGSSSEGRATLARSYRNLSEREIRAKLDGDLSEAERVTAKAELLRRGAGDDGADTTFATGFAPTSALDLDATEGQDATPTTHAAAASRKPSRPWPLVPVLVVVLAGGLAWALHFGLIRF